MTISRRKMIGLLAVTPVALPAVVEAAIGGEDLVHPGVHATLVDTTYIQFVSQYPGTIDGSAPLVGDLQARNGVWMVFDGMHWQSVSS